jgi:RNA polymerase sigma-70 factor (ECF subfamily)
LIDSSNHIADDNDLLKGCLDGDRKYQRGLYQKYSPKMYAVCLRYCNSSDDAQDVLQDGFVKVFRNLDKFRHEGSFEGWLRRIFVNTAIEHYRKKSNTYSISENVELSVPDESVTAYDKLTERDLMAVIAKLSPGYKAVFNMYVIEGYSHKEIASILGISEGTSKSQLARAKHLLQNLIKEQQNN